MKHIQRIYLLEEFPDWPQARASNEMAWVSASVRKLTCQRIAARSEVTKRQNAEGFRIEAHWASSILTNDYDEYIPISKNHSRKFPMHPNETCTNVSWLY